MVKHVDPVQFWVVDRDWVVKEACLIFFHATAVLFEKATIVFRLPNEGTILGRRMAGTMVFQISMIHLLGQKNILSHTSIWPNGRVPA